MLKSSSIAGLLLLLLVLLPLAGRAEERLPQLLQELKQAASQTRTLQSDFVQEKHLQLFAETLRSEGRFIYQQPDWLRWELLTPVASGFVLRGERGERWNGLSRELTAFSVERDPMMAIVAQQLLAWARVDLDWLQQHYQLTLLSEDPVRLQLTPLAPGEAQLISGLQIEFAPDRRSVVEVLMQEQWGDFTRLRFSNVQINTELPAESFTPPDYQ
jgi:outer membrane lipoprotein-sorting protein